MKGQLTTALAAIRANRLRSALTISIIAIGVTALVGIETAIGALHRQLAGSFGRMGAQRLALVPDLPDPHQEFPRPFSWQEASAFAAGFASFDAPLVSLSAPITPIAVISAGGRRTDPVVQVLAADEAYLAVAGEDLSEGRGFTASESSSGAAICVIGSSLSRKLFGEESAVTGRALNFSGVNYTVVGVLASGGSLFGPGNGNTLILPLAAGRRWLPEETAQWEITLLSDAARGYPESWLLEEARTRMRALRRLAPGAPDDFAIRQSDALLERLSALEEKLSLAALAIGLVTLLGAAVALMNILLVSVKERTGEIGLRKALGERTASIRRQFLTESILIGQLGGAAGIILGLLAGWGVSQVLGGGCPVPWKWLAVALGLCFLISLLAGSLPATRAARLQPVEALRGR